MIGDGGLLMLGRLVSQVCRCLRQGGEFRLILSSSFAANCPARSGSLRFGSVRRGHKPAATSPLRRTRSRRLYACVFRFDRSINQETTIEGKD